MRFLYSDILPIKLPEGKDKFQDHFTMSFKDSDEINIAVGYASKASIKELIGLVSKYPTKKICLILGMYYIEGIPEGLYHEAIKLHNLLQEHNTGEVRLIRPLKYHGKIYIFSQNQNYKVAYIGSHNLGAIKAEASNLRQYEISALTEKQEEIQELANFFDILKTAKCSLPITAITDMEIIREENRALIDQEFVEKITPEDVVAYKNHLTPISFEIPLKVPANKDDSKMKGSNINVCYASGRKRVWWEIEIVVAKEIRDMVGYPEYQKPFLAVTDDGWKFQVWTCGQNNKNLYSKDDLKIMGRWIKGRLVASGLVEPVNNIDHDINQDGVITKDMLQKYGRNTISLTKTDLKTTINGRELDIWMLSFLPESQKR